MTCQPPVPVGSTFATYPDKWTECIITATLKQKILDTPGYPKPLNRPPEKRHRIGQSPYGGLGTFATVNLKAGDLIFSERAMMILSSAMYMPENVPSHFTPAQVYQAALVQNEKVVELGFDRLLDENKKAFMALWNSHKQDGSGPLMGIARTNAYMVDLYDDDENEDEGEKMERIPYSGIWDEGSRINHSCRPNIFRHFDRVTFAMEFRAARDIKAGEEIFTQYTDPASVKSQRQKELNPYGFQCGCGSCKAFDSDLVRCQLVLGLPALVGYKRFAVFLMAPTTLSESYVVKQSLEQVNLIERAGLEVSAWYKTHLRFLVEVYCAIGDARKALICEFSFLAPH
ncbi:SET domain-containing protein [Marasmius fiardii PR-910]|nr:SET domain-containing protein [Marasmius fiardii PR-910]